MFRSFVRLYSRSAVRLATGDAKAVQPTVGEFKWTHLQSQYSLPSFQAGLGELDTKLKQFRSELFGVPDSVPQVDWKAYDDIEDKDAVKHIRSEYESAQFPLGEADNVAEMNESIDFAIQRTTENAKICQEEIKRLREELAAAQKEKTEVHNWTIEDYCKRYPGLAEQLRHEYMEGYTLPTDAMDRLGETDVAEARKAFNAGTPPIALEPNLPTAVGDFDINKEKQRLNDQLQKLFGDAPDVEQLIHDVDAKLGPDVPHGTPAVVAKH